MEKTQNKSAHKVNSEEEHSLAAPARIWTCYLLIMSPTLLLTNYPSSLDMWTCQKKRFILPQDIFISHLYLCVLRVWYVNFTKEGGSFHHSSTRTWDWCVNKLKKKCMYHSSVNLLFCTHNREDNFCHIWKALLFSLNSRFVAICIFNGSQPQNREDSVYHCINSDTSGILDSLQLASFIMAAHRKLKHTA